MLLANILIQIIAKTKKIFNLKINYQVMILLYNLLTPNNKMLETFLTRILLMIQVNLMIWVHVSCSLKHSLLRILVGVLTKIVVHSSLIIRTSKWIIFHNQTLLTRIFNNLITSLLLTVHLILIVNSKMAVTNFQVEIKWLVHCLCRSAKTKS